MGLSFRPSVGFNMGASGVVGCVGSACVGCGACVGFSVFPDESGLRMFRGVQFQFRDHASLDGGVAVCGSVSPRVVCSCFCVPCGL